MSKTPLRPDLRISVDAPDYLAAACHGLISEERRRRAAAAYFDDRVATERRALIDAAKRRRWLAGDPVTPARPLRGEWSNGTFYPSD